MSPWCLLTLGPERPRHAMSLDGMLLVCERKVGPPGLLFAHLPLMQA